MLTVFIDCISDKVERCDMYDAIINYGLYGTILQFDAPYQNMAWNQIR